CLLCYFNAPSPTEIYALSLHDALPILKAVLAEIKNAAGEIILFIDELHLLIGAGKTDGAMDASNLLKPMLARGELHCIGATTLRSEEHTSELQSPCNLVCRLLLEKKKQ